MLEELLELILHWLAGIVNRYLRPRSAEGRIDKVQRGRICIESESINALTGIKNYVII